MKAGLKIITIVVLSATLVINYLLLHQETTVKDKVLLTAKEQYALGMHSKPNLSPENRLVYNRVAKAASTSMTQIINTLARKNTFTLVNDLKYLPAHSNFTDILTNLDSDSLYINHASVALGAPNIQWFNIANIYCEPDDVLLYH